MSNMLELLQAGSLKTEYPRIAAGQHTFAVTTFAFTKAKNKLGVIGEIIRVNLVALESTVHKPGTQWNTEFWIGFPDRDFVGQQMRKVEEALTFVKHAMGLDTVEETRDAMTRLFQSAVPNPQDTASKESRLLFGVRVTCAATAGVSKKGTAFVNLAWGHVDGQTPEVLKEQAGELAGFLGITVPAAAPAPVGGSLLSSLKR
jgi:hypothetical protein